MPCENEALVIGLICALKLNPFTQTFYKYRGHVCFYFNLCVLSALPPDLGFLFAQDD